MKTTALQPVRWSGVFLVLLLGVLPVSFPGLDQDRVDTDRFPAQLIVEGGEVLLPSARGEAPDDYLIQTEAAMRQYESHVQRLSIRASEVDPLTRCSFQVERRKYYDKLDALRQGIQRARERGPDSTRTRGEIEAHLDELKSAYSRALACYR